MRRMNRGLLSALTIKNVTIFVILVMSIIFVFAVYISASLPRKIVEDVFPGYVMRSYQTTPLSELEPPDITYHIDQQDLEELLLNEEDIIITYSNILSFKNFDIPRKNLYNIDKTAYVSDDDLDFEKLLDYRPNVNLYGDAPKILIFHTHASEAFADSREGIEADTIVGVGDTLASILQKYGISVLHHKGVYDMEDGKIMRGGSYEKMEPDIRQILAENPSIELVIDLHRDALPEGKRLITDIDGRDTAQIMFFNGICRLNENGEPVETEGLENEFIYENLALSLRMKLLANEAYPGFARKNYIKPYRYSLHMKPNSLLIECGSDSNTVNEVKNAMEPLAEVLVRAFL